MRQRNTIRGIEHRRLGFIVIEFGKRHHGYLFHFRWHSWSWNYDLAAEENHFFK